MTAILLMVGIPSAIMIYQFIAYVFGICTPIALTKAFIWTTIIRESVVRWGGVFGLIGIGVCILEFVLWRTDRLDDSTKAVPLWMCIVFVILGVLSII